MTNKIDSVINKIKSSLFLKQASSLGAGTIAAHLITLAISPVITRMYTPDEFGVYSLFHSIVVTLSYVATASYEYAIVLPKEEKKGKQLFKTALIISLLFTFLCYLGLYLTAPYLSSEFALSIPFLLLLPLGILFYSGYKTYMYWSIRKEYYSTIAWSKITMSGGTGFFQLGFGVMGFTGIGLFSGYVIGRLAAVCTMFFSNINEYTKLIKSWQYKPVKNVVQEYIDHPKYVLTSSLLSTGSIELPVFLIGYLFGSEELGFYGLAFRVLMAPVTLVSVSVGHVFFQRFAKRKNNRLPLAEYLVKMWRILFAVSVIPFAIIFIYSESVFTLIFGDEWIIAGTIGSVLAPMLLFTFITTPTSKALLVLEKQKVLPVFSTVSIVVRLVALVGGSIYLDFIMALWLMAAGQIIIYIIQNIYTFYCAKRIDLR